MVSLFQLCFKVLCISKFSNDIYIIDSLSPKQKFHYKDIYEH